MPEKNKHGRVNSSLANMIFYEYPLCTYLPRTSILAGSLYIFAKDEYTRKLVDPSKEAEDPSYRGCFKNTHEIIDTMRTSSHRCRSYLSDKQD